MLGVFERNMIYTTSFLWYMIRCGGLLYSSWIMTRVVLNVEEEVSHDKTDALMTTLIFVTFSASHRDD